MLDSIEAIANDVITKLDEEATLYFSQCSLKDARLEHHTLGRWIRNSYNLWESNPLTERWRKDESSRDIRDGVDYSSDHPDQVSDEIIQLVWKKLRGIAS